MHSILITELHGKREAEGQQCIYRLLSHYIILCNYKVFPIPFLFMVTWEHVKGDLLLFVFSFFLSSMRNQDLWYQKSEKRQKNCL